MREGWVETTLGSVAEKRTDFTQVDPDEEYVILGVQRSGWGFVEREPIKGSAQKFTKLMRLNKDDLVYRTITAFEAPSAVAGPEHAGLFVTPQTFPVFRVDERRLLPAYMALLTTWPSFHEEMASRCTGTVLRRKTLSVGAFKSIPLALPPLAEQRRIVDLVGALDDAIAAAELANECVRQLSRSLREAVFAGPGRRVPVGSEYAVSVGKQLQSKSTQGDFHPYLRAGNIADGELDLTVMKEMRFTYAEIERLTLLPNDVVIVEGGNGYGKSALWPEGIPGTGFQNHVLRLRALGEEYTPWYAFQWARWCHEQGHFKYTGTGIPNLGVGKVRQMEILLAEDADAAALDALDDLHQAERSAASVVGALRATRSNLLTVLLSGEHEIPKSYDELLEVAS